MDTTLQSKEIQYYNKVFSSTLTAEETGESVVPDKMPDMGMIAHTGACVLLRGKEVSDGTLQVRGELAVTVLYIPDGESGLRALRLTLPVAANFEDASITQQSVPEASMGVCGVEARMLNPRKILVKAEVATEVACYERSRAMYCTGVAPEEMDGIQLRYAAAQIGLTGTVCERTFVLTDEYPMPTGDAAGEVVWQNAQFRVEDVKAIANKLIIKGTVLSEVVCLSPEGVAETVRFPTMFSQILETDSEEVSPEARLTIMPTGLYYELVRSDAGTKLTMELHGVCQAAAMSRHEIRYVADAYSNRRSCQVEHRPVQACARSKVSVLRETVRETLPCRSGVSAVRLAACQVGTVTPGEGSATARVDVTVCVGYENGTEDSVSKRIQVEFTGEEIPGARWRVDGVRCTDVYAVPTGSSVEVRFSAEADLRAETEVQLDTVSAIHLEDEVSGRPDRPSLTVVRSGGPLWDIARKYGSTVDLIRRVNAMEEDTAPADCILFVPRERF